MKKPLKQLMIALLAAVLITETPLSVSAAAPAKGAVSSNGMEQSAPLSLDEEHFPDETFRTYLAETFDADGDGILRGEELDGVVSLDVSGMGIYDLQGITCFTNLKELDCSYNRLSSLELDGLSSLLWVKADHNAYLCPDDDKAEESGTEKDRYLQTILLKEPEETATGLISPKVFAEVAVEEANFPDANFLEYIEAYLDTDHDGVLSPGELAQTTVIHVGGWDVEDLTGISYFTNLVFLNYGDMLTVLPDLSGSPYLLEAVSGEEGDILEEPDAEILEDALSDNGISGNGFFENTGSKDNSCKGAVSENNVSGNSVSDNSVSENSLSTDDASIEDLFPDGVASSSDVKGAAESVEKEEEEPPFVVETPRLSKAKNSAKGKVSLSYSACSNASGYEIEYCQKSSFSKNAVQVETKKTTAALTNLPKGKKYYFRVRAYGIDREGNRVYSAYSNVLSAKIKKGVAEVKYSVSAGKVKQCKIVKTNTLQFSAGIKKRVASSDDYYYLCQVDPYTDKKIRLIDKGPKTTTFKLSLPAATEDGTNLIEGKYAVFIKSKGKYKRITNAVYISNPEAAAGYTAPFPKSASKKGIQGAVGRTELGVSHSLINIPLTDVIATKETGIPYVYNGKTYYFTPAPYVGVINKCNRDNVTVSAVFLLPWDENLKSLITSKGRTPGAANYYAWNTSGKASRETLEAAFMYLAELYSRESCHLDNWILGNEINAGHIWNYAGNMS